MSKPILFYSKKSERCINLWNQLAKDNILHTFIKICVDNNPKIPKIITTVPSIFIKSRGVITEAAIPMYLNSLHNSQSNIPLDANGNPSNHPSFDQSSQEKSSIPNNTSDSLTDFNPVEMGDRWSDSYSFIKEQSEPISFSFQMLNNDKNNLIQKTNEKSDSSDYKQRQSDFQSRLDHLQQARTQI